MRIALSAAALVLAVLAGDAASRPGVNHTSVGAGVAEALADHGAADVIVAFRPGSRGSPTAVRRRVLSRLAADGGFVVTTRWETVSAMAGTVTPRGLSALRADPDVAAIDLDLGGGGGDAESLALIRASAAQQAGVVGTGVTVAVVDSGIDRAHPDLADAVAGEHCFVPPSGCPNRAAEQDGPGSAQDDHGHGTHVAGIVTANGTAAPIGVAPAARIVAVKVLDAANRFAGTSQVLSGLDWIAASRPDVRVVNLSLGTDQLFTGTCDEANATTSAFASVVAVLRARGVLVVASAMNAGSPTSLALPACVGGVVAVGAVYDTALGSLSSSVCTDPATAPDRVACFSNSSPALDLLAPGVRVLSARLGGGASESTGTSQAAPHVSGAAALLLQAAPALMPDGVEGVLEASGSPVLDERNGIVTPRIDVASALDRVRGAPPPPPPPPPPPAPSAARVAPGRLSFGRVRVGRAQALRVRLANAGGSPLVVRRPRARAPFSVSPTGPLTLAPGSALRLTVTFRPRRVGRFRGALALGTNDPNAPAIVVTLLGTGVRR